MVYDSVYEITNPLSTVAKQHFVDWFVGNAINAKKWDTVTVNSASIAMQDWIDGGFMMRTGTTNASYAQVLFDDNYFGHFNRAGCSCVWVARPSIVLPSGGSFLEMGIGFQVYNNGAWARATGNGSNYYLRTARSESFTDVDTGVEKDKYWHTWKIDFASDGGATGGYAHLSCDGIQRATSTTNLQSQDRMQPVSYLSFGNDATDKRLYVKYCEAWSH